MSEEWKATLPESLQSWDEVTNSDSPEKFWEQMSNQRKLIGDSIRIPSEEAGDDSWNAFNEKIMNKVPTLMRTPNSDDSDSINDVLKRLGKPEDVDGYKLLDITDTEVILSKKGKENIILSTIERPY